MNDASVMNNYGALLGSMGKKDEEIRFLELALALEPNAEHTLVNLAGFYQDEGQLDLAAEYFTRAFAVAPLSTPLPLRLALMQSPVVASWAQMLVERNRIADDLLALLEQHQHTPQQKFALDASLDRIHFYTQYPGLNDYYLQNLVALAYDALILDVAVTVPRLESPDAASLEHLQAQFKTNDSISTPTRRARIGFMSKFFGIFEPHGLLLDGVMQYLPRDRFEVIILVVSTTDGKPISSSIAEAADSVVYVSLQHGHALQMVARQNLDVLVFADTMSEPINHFLAQSRMAPVQVGDSFDAILFFVCFLSLLLL